MSSTKASSVHLELMLQSGNLSRIILLWITDDRLLKATSTVAPSSRSLKYKKEKKTSTSLIMWHWYMKHTIGRLCPSSSRCKELRGQPQRDQGRTSGKMCTCEEIERGTHAQRASMLGWTHDGKLRITIPDNPPESSLRRRKRLLYFTCSYCLLSHV